MMQPKHLSSSKDADTLELEQKARIAVAKEISNLLRKGIPVHYRENPNGPLIREFPDGTRKEIAPGPSTFFEDIPRGDEKGFTGEQRNMGRGGI
jgi:hypothetical protein